MLSVTLLLAAVLAAAVGLVIGNAHHAIADEMDSSVKLATDLIDASMDLGSASGLNAADVAEIGHIRHVCLTLIKPGHSGPPCPRPRHEAQAPAWFSAITRPRTIPEARIAISGDRQIRVLADPQDEIDETWAETRGLLALLVVFYVAIVAIVYVLLGRATIPVQRIDAALRGIEHGDYDIRLPNFSLPEFDGIAAQFNHMAATLAMTREENHRLRERSLRIQEDERRTLARELHDELGQSLTAIRADAAGIVARGEQLPDSVGESATAIAEVAGAIYDRTRAIMHRLRPPGLDELGLADALEEHVAGAARIWPDVVFAFDSRGEGQNLAPEIAIHVFRLVQEALTNALRHGAPRHITVDLNTGAARLALCIADDGRGFLTEQRAPGLGLAGMRERVELLGGRFELTSQPGRGCRIVADVPLGQSKAKPGRLPIEAGEAFRQY